MIDVVGQLGLHQHIAGEVAFLDSFLLAANNFNDFLCRNLDLFDKTVQTFQFSLIADVLRDLFFKVRIGVDDVPFGLSHGRGSP